MGNITVLLKVIF